MNKLLIITGKSGSGKDTVLNMLSDKFNFERLITCTTRPKREGESDGVEYYFISDKEFELFKKYKRFIEYREYRTLFNNIPQIWKYGTLKMKLNDNKQYAIVLDLEGAKKFKEYYGDECQTIYIDCDNEIRKNRAMNRGSFDITEWNRRLKTDENDFTKEKRCDIIDIEYDNNNSDLNELCEKILKNFKEK